MFKTIEGAADCEIRSVILLLNDRNVLPSKIHHQICQLYGDSAMSDGVVRKWVRMFNEGQENVYDEARSGHPSLVNDDLVHKVNRRVHNNRHFTISDLSLHFSSDFKDSMTLSVVANITGGCILRGGYTKTCAPLR